eukprot:c6951_g1_i1.p1 GENE.c6951_g1_i1~~c6951_g1_i1.p1  ORF type:complete len:467 (+),score=116.38 c6951_g1_i1:38-1438(+)
MWSVVCRRHLLAGSIDAQALIPRRIVKELDRHIVGQSDAKRAVAVALRNRWRRHQLPDALKDEVIPKNILMIGPTGVGKTEIVRRMSKLIDAPFIKVEATKFTEVGFHGRDVDQIIRDLVDLAIIQTKEKARLKSKEKIKDIVDHRLVELLTGETSGRSFEQFLALLREGALEERIVDVPRSIDSGNPKKIPITTIMGSGGNTSFGAVDIGEVIASLTNSSKPSSGPGKRLPIREARPLIEEDETRKLADREDVVQEAIKAVEEDGVVFIDEIDKICSTARSYGSGASDEGVQKDLLPLIEGCSINTKHGDVKTHHILFIASGAFSSCKPSDLLAELQGRLPIRVELQPLSQEDLLRILTEPEHNLIAQQKALLKTENLDVQFTEDAIAEIASVASEVNRDVENIGARRLHTIIERVIEQISFDAPELATNEQTDEGLRRLVIDKSFVRDRVGNLLKKTDLRKFIL